MITSFRGKYSFLSNFYPCPVVLDEETYPTVEHAFQASKTRCKDARRVIREASTPSRAKRMGREVTLRDDWEFIKLEVMYRLVRQKFACSDMYSQLLETDSEVIVKCNQWHDNFWGNCICPKCTDTPGQNWLGKILMGVRDTIRSWIGSDDGQGVAGSDDSAHFSSCG